LWLVITALYIISNIKGFSKDWRHFHRAGIAKHVTGEIWDALLVINAPSFLDC
jgi:hypothetical protein